MTGTPIAGDTITIEYTKEERGTITNSNPSRFHSTGWNLYNNTVGYARVVRYSDEYGYRIDGAFTAVEFATTVTGARETISVESNGFMVPEDGFIFVTGGDSTTAVYTTWSDWMEGYEGDFQPYTVSTVDFSAVMQAYFPFGLAQVRAAQDEININLGTAISRIDRLPYSASNLATVIESGVDYDYDTGWIYFVKEYEDTYSIEVDGSYAAYDKGIEYFDGTQLPVDAQMIYGVNLKNRLERDVVTISSGLANNLTTTESGQALDARQGKVLGDKLANNTWSFDLADEIPENTDLNNLTAVGNYRVTTPAKTDTLINAPLTGVAMLLRVETNTTSDYVTQIAYPTTGGKWYKRRVRVSTNAATAWESTALQSDLDTLSTAMGSVKHFSSTFAANSSKEFAIGNNFRGLVYTFAGTTARCGQSFIISSSTGTINTVPIVDASEITLTTAKNSLTITSTGSTITMVVFFIFGGSVSEAAES